MRSKTYYNFFSNKKDDIDLNILEMISEKGACKWFLSCLIKFSKQTGEGGDERVDTVAGFSSRTSISTESDMSEETSIEAIDNAYFKLYKDIGNFPRAVGVKIQTLGGCGGS